MKKLIWGTLLLIIGISSGASAQDWVSNGSYSMKLNGYTEHKSLQDIPMVRVDKTVKKYVEDANKWMKKNEYKVIVLDAAFRNDTEKEQGLGYAAWVTNDFYRTIYLRGEEGTEVNPLESRGSYRPGQGGSIKNGLTYYLKGGMPMNSKVSPGTVVKGKIIYFVSDWYVPTVGFTKIKANIAGDSPELFGKTRLKQEVSRRTAAAAKPGKATGKFCTSCGTKAEMAHKFCAGCGSKL